MTCKSETFKSIPKRPIIDNYTKCQTLILNFDISNTVIFIIRLCIHNNNVYQSSSYYMNTSIRMIIVFGIVCITLIKNCARLIA